MFDSIGATQIEMLEFVESIKEIWSNISSIKAKEGPKSKSKPKKVEKYEDDYYDEDDDNDDMAAIRARKAMFKKPAQTTNEDEGNNHNSLYRWTTRGKRSFYELCSMTYF